MDHAPIQWLIDNKIYFIQSPRTPRERSGVDIDNLDCTKAFSNVDMAALELLCQYNNLYVVDDWTGEVTYITKDSLIQALETAKEKQWDHGM